MRDIASLRMRLSTNAFVRKSESLEGGTNTLCLTMATSLYSSHTELGEGILEYLPEIMPCGPVLVNSRNGSFYQHGLTIIIFMVIMPYNAPDELLAADNSNCLVKAQRVRLHFQLSAYPIGNLRVLAV